MPKETAAHEEQSSGDEGPAPLVKQNKDKKKRARSTDKKRKHRVSADPPEKTKQEGSEEEVDSDTGDSDVDDFVGEDDGAPEVDEQPEEEDGQEDAALSQRAAMMRRKKAKLVGYRNLARAAGYLDKYADDVNGSAGRDGTGCVVSIADAKRCHMFVPATPGATSYGNHDEFSKRHALFAKGMSDSAARESQVRIDSVMRGIVREALLRTVEAGKKTISASVMQSVLRPASENMLFTAGVPPLGLVRYGQTKGLLSTSAADAAKKQEEKAEASKARKLVAEYVKSEQERLAAMRAAKAERVAERAAA